MAEDKASQLAREIVGAVWDCTHIDSDRYIWIDKLKADSKVAALLRTHLGERWIPVRERLPKASTTIEPDILFKCGNDWRSGTFQSGNFVDAGGWIVVNVDAWRPLPSPPGGKEGE